MQYFCFWDSRCKFTLQTLGAANPDEERNSQHEIFGQLSLDPGCQFWLQKPRDTGTGGLKARHGPLTYPCFMMCRHCFSSTCTSCLRTYFPQGAVLGAGHTIRPCFASVPNTSLPLVSSLSRSGHLTGYLQYMADGSLLVFFSLFIFFGDDGSLPDCVS